MKFKKEDISSLIKEIGECSSMEEARGKLVDFQKGLEEDYTEHDTALSETAKYKQEAEKLREDNMKLFLQITDGKPKEPEKPKEKLKFENLFDEKGGIK